MTVHDDLTLIRRELAITGTDEAWEALKRLEKDVEELTNAARNAIAALVADPEPTYEYGATYVEPTKPVSISNTLEAARDSQEFYNGIGEGKYVSRVYRRTKGIPAGDWEEVDE